MGSCASKGPVAANPTDTGKTQAKRQEQTQVLKTNANKDASKPLAQNSSSSDSYGLEKALDGTTNPVDIAAAQEVNSKKEVKVLLLGSGESGKSTIVKQMKILHQNGYTKEELYEYKPFVYKNVLDCIRNVINAIIELQPDLIKREGVDDAHSEESLKEYKGSVEKPIKHLKQEDMDLILDYEFSIDSEEPFSLDVADKIREIYNNSAVQKFIKVQQGNFYLIDSTHYFLTDIGRISDPNYIPSVNDVLRTRKKTSGIFDFTFQMGNGLNIHMYDVGGQRSERKKWIHCFDNVTLIIYCVALSEYDQVLLEESSQNRLEESLNLFDSVVNSRWFARTSIVLFLNKIDVFADKFPYSPLESHFPDYTGGSNINKAAKYILWRFTQVNRSGLNIYPHVTQATDTSNIQLVFAAVKETILENSLRDSGIL